MYNNSWCICCAPLQLHQLFKLLKYDISKTFSLQILFFFYKCHFVKVCITIHNGETCRIRFASKHAGYIFHQDTQYISCTKSCRIHVLHKEMQDACLASRYTGYMFLQQTFVLTSVVLMIPQYAGGENELSAHCCGCENEQSAHCCGGNDTTICWM